MADRAGGDVDRLVTCDCHIEAMRIVRFADEPESTYVSLWVEKQYGGHSRSWRQRLRHIWQIIRKGEPWEDEICLSSRASFQLAKALLGAPEDTTTVHWGPTTFNFTNRSTA